MRTPYYEDDTVTLLHGDALDVARTLAPKSVRTIVTSPPYFGLRDYGMEAQYGAESTVQDYVAHLVELFRELRDALTDDGTLWLNLGDSWASRWGSQRDRSQLHLPDNERQRRPRVEGFVDKQLLMTPARTAIALQDDGWILRSDIIWAKPNSMPEGVADRPTKSHEHVFLLAKSPRYFYDAAAIAEPVADSTVSRLAQSNLANQTGAVRANGGAKTNGNMKAVGNGVTRNKRDVWTVQTVPFADAHFALYPPELIRPCILAGSEEGDTVLDPFSGSGTTGMVATQEGRKYIGIDLNSDYLDLSLRTRFAQPTLNMGAVS